jgi:hypothetical protein
MVDDSSSGYRVIDDGTFRTGLATGVGMDSEDEESKGEVSRIGEDPPRAIP